MALLPEAVDHPFDVVALHFDHPVFHGAAAAARGLELLGPLRQRVVIQRQSLDHGDGLAVAALGFTRDAHDAVA